MRFGDLSIGDVFNTKPGRYRKTGESEAVVIQSALSDIGSVVKFNEDHDVILIKQDSGTHRCDRCGTSVTPRFRCPICEAWVCGVCWNQEIGFCQGCTPD